MEEKKQRSLAEELKEKLSQDSETIEEIKEESKESAEDISDKEIEKKSNSITKKEIKVETKKLKENVDGKKETLIPLEDYIKCAVHLGTKVITPHMKKYVYKRRADGLAVINTSIIDEKIRSAIEFLNKFDVEKVYIVCKREAGWDSAKLFGEITGINTFTKKYPPGITTNLELDNFFESELTIICDPWIDKNALNDTARLKKPVLSLCDTNNYTTNVTQLIPCNNKSKKSIGCVLYLLARGYCKTKNIPFTATLEDFTGPLE
ncbi:30S ribosomal protein S2 [archaeon]|jgi:small subunit ribosomal protein S2|nr:30S ribosomal protein S2 [Candidatus Woesearchaeota archaeon]MBT4136111.1 30S ribosomal protein S2 [archaeon]MBT4242242.1 30S ribosomal protein S2 [archaeon]MBT4417930.1 30S ribosomal protein S2 [archaeon]